MIPPPPRRGREGTRGRLKRMLYILAAIYIGWCLLLYTQQDRMMFPRDMLNAPSPEAAIPRSVERLWIEPEPGGGVRVEAWLLRARVDLDGRAPAVVMMHGNAELIDECTGDAVRWNLRGRHVLLCEYRGYGRSTGRPSQRAIVGDAAAFYDLLAARPDVDPSDILVHGRSLGAAAAAQLAVARPAAGVVLESPFRSATSFAARFGVPPFLVKNPFRTTRAIAATDAPVIILHSRDDEIIPISHARALKRARPDATLVELTGGHNSGISGRAEYWAAIDAWLGSRRVTPPAPGPLPPSRPAPPAPSDASPSRGRRRR